MALPPSFRYMAPRQTDHLRALVRKSRQDLPGFLSEFFVEGKVGRNRRDSALLRLAGIVTDGAWEPEDIDRIVYGEDWR